MQTIFLIIPGYGNSDNRHWQTYFESQLPNCLRIEQKSWDKPICGDWVEAIQDTVRKYEAGNVLLVSHSMGGIAIAQWALKHQAPIKGAFIVAPPDLENPYMDLGLESFIPIPMQAFPFPSLIVGSTNDPWATEKRTKEFALAWGSQLLFIGEAGHINVGSGFGNWIKGLDLLKEFANNIDFKRRINR